MITVGSLFSGIGGLDLGLERAGMGIRWQAETDPYATRVLAKHWPDTPNLGDVTTIDWETIEHVDLVCGGFPCQPVSNAGRKLAQADERWLWPEFARCLRGVRPRYVLVENVPGLLVRGMGDVLGDLAALGFDAIWDCIPAAALGAPHLRWRLFIVAAQGRVPDAFGEQLRLVGQRNRQQRDEPGEALPGFDGEDWPLADTDGAERWARPQGDRPHGDHARRDEASGGTRAGGEERGVRAVANAEVLTERAGLRESGAGWLGRGRSGDSGGQGHAWTAEPDVGRVAHGVPCRVDRLRTLGNAVVPQISELIGRQIMEEISA